MAGQEKLLIRGVRYRDIAQLLAEIAAVSSLAANLLQPCLSQLCCRACCCALATAFLADSCSSSHPVHYGVQQPVP